MKTLLILRHAKSSKDDPSIEDHERPLDDRGKKDAPRMGVVLRDEGWVPDLIVSSTAVRAKATAEAAAKTSGYEGDIALESSLYDASPKEYVDALRQIPDRYEQVMLVGHNPGLEQLLGLLTGTEESLPTAGLARIGLPIEGWDELRTRTPGKLEDFRTPKHLEG